MVKLYYNNLVPSELSILKLKINSVVYWILEIISIQLQIKLLFNNSERKNYISVSQADSLLSSLKKAIRVPSTSQKQTLVV